MSVPTNVTLAPLIPIAFQYSAGLHCLWALCQWRAYGGLYLGPGLSLLLVGLWYAARRRRELRQAPPGQPIPGRRQRWGGLLDCLARSALAMAACCLLIHLAVAPAAVRSVEDDYQRIMAYIRDPDSYWARVRQAEAAIRADAAAMEDIRASVAQTLAFEQSAEEELAGEEPMDEEANSEP